MRYLGIDVHSQTSTWCVLEPTGDIADRGRISTTEWELRELVQRLAPDRKLVVGQEVGSYAYFVHDVLTSEGIELLSFNANHLRMIASSRKKSDRRDAYWIAKSLQTGMMPHPVYIPQGECRELRQILSRREVIKRDRARWALRARGSLKPYGLSAPAGVCGVLSFIAAHDAKNNTLPDNVYESLKLCERQIKSLSAELKKTDQKIRDRSKDIEDTQRLMTIPGVGWLTATIICAWVGDIRRFPTARHLAAYAGLVPTVRQSGASNHLGHITKEGTPALRTALVQGAHSVMTSRISSAAPLREIFNRVRRTRGRYKIATVALARHLIRIAFYVLRDGTTYESSKLRKVGT